MSTASQTPLAIVGLSCQLPAAPEAESFWAQALAGASGLSDCPPEWAADAGIHSPMRGGRLSDFPFDWKAFRVPPQSASKMHRAERVLMQVVAQSMLDAGFVPNEGPERCGIYLGASGIGIDEEINYMLRLRSEELHAALGSELAARGHPKQLQEQVARALDAAAPSVTVDSLSTTASVVAGRVSALFNTTGGHFAVDAGPASSLAALRLAAQALTLAHCDVAVVGALSPLLSASTYAVLRARGWLAEAAFEPLGQQAGGTLPGEGAASLVLCRLEDAERDGRRVYAVLRGIAEASQFSHQGLSRLSKIVDRAAREALDAAAVDPDAVGHAELQACGVVPWEDEELLGVRSAYACRRAGPISVSAASAQVGFQQAASGMVSMLRAVLAVHHRNRPPTAGGIDFRRSALGELQGLSSPAPLAPEMLVAVSNTAGGGTAFHALVGPASSGRERKRPAPKRRPRVEEKIAIVGMGAVAPGAKDAPTLWRNILGKVDAIRDLPASRFDVEKFLRPFLSEGATVPRLAGLAEISKLDPQRFKLPPATLARLDRAIHLSLLAGAEAIESAGYQEGSWDRRRVKVIFGQLPLRERELELERRFTCERYLRLARGSLRAQGLGAAQLEPVIEGARNRYSEGILSVTEDAFQYYSGMACASRLAACYDFSGGALSVDAACASSMVAVHAGAMALLLGEADVVIAGGVAYNLLPEYFVALCALNVVCARGSFPFDDRADGFVPAEGAGAVVLKRLEAAEAARDKILAVITGIGSSSDGRGTSIFAPSPAGQARAVERALEAAQVDPGWVDLVEAHGSGTRRSDVSEATAYGKVFEARGRDNPVAVGSVKSQIGHLSSAGGILGLIKTAYALSEQVLPPMNGGEYPNPEIPFERLPLELSLEARPWRLPLQGVRRAGVSAFALGGSNYHLLLEEHDNIHRRDRRVDPSPASRPAPLPPRGLFANRWAVDLVPLALSPAKRFALGKKKILLLVEREDLKGRLASALTLRGTHFRVLSLKGVTDAAEVERRVRAEVEALEGVDGVIDAMEFAPAEYFLALGHQRFWQLAQETSARWLGTSKALYRSFEAATDRSACYLALTSMGGDFGFLGDGGNVLGGSICGFLKGLKQELPALVTKVVDFEATLDCGQVAERALQELEEGSDRVEVGHFCGRRFGVGMKRASFVEGDDVRRAIDPAWVLLFSGGGRGAVFEVAKAVARLGTRVVLTGRTPPPTGSEPYLALEDDAFEAYRREEMVRQKKQNPSLTPVKFAEGFDVQVRTRELFKNLAEVFALGLPIQYEVCDVTDPAQVRTVVEGVRGLYGRIDGVVHGAMVEASKSLPDKTATGVEATLASKALGLIHLLEATAGDELKLVMCFGSGAGRFGNRGQSDYCAANDLMSKVAMAWGHRANPSTRCVTLDWTAWERVGAAARARRMVESTGVSFISPLEGVFWFINEFMLGGSEREVAIFEERLFREWPFLGSSAEGPHQQRVFDDRGLPLVPSDIPMVDRLIRVRDGQLVSARTFDLSRDRFLHQHQLYGVPILPGTFGFELIAEGASLIRPDLTVLRCEKMEIGVPLKLFRAQSVLVEIEARILEQVGAEVRVEVETRSALKLGQSDLLQTRIHHRGVVVLGAAPKFEPGSGVLPEALPGARARSIFHLAKDPVYLGPLFCRAEWVYVGEETVEGIIRAPRQRDIFSEITRPHFLLDPLLMDAAFQVAANWDGHHHKVVSVPMGAAGIRRGRMRRLDEGAHVVARPVGVVGPDTFYDIRVNGDDGSLLLEIERLGLRRLDASRPEEL
jgi:enediyne polyketide synthase